MSDQANMGLSAAFVLSMQQSDCHSNTSQIVIMCNAINSHPVDCIPLQLRHLSAVHKGGGGSRNRHNPSDRRFGEGCCNSLPARAASSFHRRPTANLQAAIGSMSLRERVGTSSHLVTEHVKVCRERQPSPPQAAAYLRGLIPGTRRTVDASPPHDEQGLPLDEGWLEKKDGSTCDDFDALLAGASYSTGLRLTSDNTNLVLPAAVQDLRAYVQPAVTSHQPGLPETACSRSHRQPLTALALH